MDPLALFIGIGAAIVGSLIILIALIIYLVFLRNRRSTALEAQKQEQAASADHMDQQVYEEIEEDRNKPTDRTKSIAPPSDNEPSHIYYTNDTFETEPNRETDADGRPIGNGIVRNGVVSFTTPEYHTNHRFKKKTQKGKNEHGLPGLPKGNNKQKTQKGKKEYGLPGLPKGNNNNDDDDDYSSIPVHVGLRNIHDTMY